jgi:biopolymer transport protein ExbD
MRFKRHVELEHGLRPIDITPLIDMVFQLLIFFMLTSSFVVQSGITVNLPKAASAEVSQNRSLIITISRENILYRDNKVITNKELKAALLNAQKRKIPVLIMADQYVNLGRVVEVWDMARDLGVEQVNIAADRE